MNEIILLIAPIISGAITALVLMRYMDYRERKLHGRKKWPQ